MLNRWFVFVYANNEFCQFLTVNGTSTQLISQQIKQIHYRVLYAHLNWVNRHPTANTKELLEWLVRENGYTPKMTTTDLSDEQFAYELSTALAQFSYIVFDINNPDSVNSLSKHFNLQKNKATI